MTAVRIFWKPEQVVAVTTEIARLIDLANPGFDWNSGTGDIPEKWIRRMLPEAQRVLTADLHRKTWSPNNYTSYTSDVTLKLRKMMDSREQEKKKTEHPALEEIPLQKLIEEVNARTQKQVVNAILQNLRGEILETVRETTEKMILQEMDRVKSVFRHNPLPFATSDAEAVVLPTYVAVGLKPSHEHIMDTEYKDKCKFIFIGKGEHKRADQVCRNRIAFIMEGFLDHSLTNKIEKISLQSINVGSGMSSLKESVNRRLVEYETAKAKT